MRVLFLGTGTSPHVQRPLRQLLARGVEVIFADQVNPLPQGAPNFKYVWYPYFGRCVYRRVGHILGDYLARYSFIPILRQIKKKHKPDIIHVHWVDCHAYYCTQANLHPLVLSVLGSDINSCLAVGVDAKHAQKIGFALSNADKVIVDSVDMIDKCDILAGHPLENVELLHLGINLSIFEGHENKSKSLLRQQYKLPLDARVLLSARAFTPLYRHEEILLAFSKILPILQQKTVLVFKRFNESDKDYYAKILAFIKKLGIEDFIRWVEQVPDVGMPDLYYISDVIVNFPAQDAFPVTFLEAAVSQKPVITNRLPSYENTFVVDYFRVIKDDSVDGLAQALFDELEATPTPLENIQKARLVAANLFSEEHYINRLAKIYKNLLPKASLYDNKENSI